MITAIIVIVFTILGADALYSRSRLTLRRRAAAQPPQPAWNLSSPSSGNGWHPIDEGFHSTDGPDAEGTDLSRLFRGRDSHGRS
jgi:hypothetical protein